MIGLPFSSTLPTGGGVVPQEALTPTVLKAATTSAVL
ncbi:Uncharacterised protein [Vibrio cholerae]|nr:Uncharacterised protein [Vibrio cholerae]